jgi:hypothetical protein
MALRFFTILTGRKLPQIRQPRPYDEPPPINEGAIAYFGRILEEKGIMKPDDGRKEKGQD